MKKSIGIFGGSFDPIHFGHLNLAVEIMEACALDEVWFCPAAFNPLKGVKSPRTDAERLAMINLAIEGQPRFRVTDVDVARKGPSYAIDTLTILKESEQEKGLVASFSLILGSDSAKSFYQWRDPEGIIKQCHLLIGSRNGNLPDEFSGSPEVVAALKQGVTPTRIMEISSTDIRYRLGKGLYCGHLVPGKVLDYIHLNSLYCSPNN